MTHKLRIAVLAVAGLLALPILASAAHWSHFGADAGRSGFQPQDMGLLPINSAFRQIISGRPQTSPVITDAPADGAQRVAFGAIRRASDGGTFCEVHLFALDANGTRIGTPNDICPRGDTDAFGERPATNATDMNTVVRQGSVTPVSASMPGAYGQLYFLVNNRNTDARVVAGGPQTAPSNNDIAIAQIDERTGAEVALIAVGTVPTTSAPTGGRTQGFEIESSPVITPPLNAAGDRWLFFVAQPDPDLTGTDTDPKPPTARLFKVVIPAAHTQDSLDAIPAVSEVDVPGANPYASPTLAYLRDPGRGDIIPYVVVSGGNPSLRTFKATNLAPGPTAPAGVVGAPQTASVPVRSSGDIAGSTGAGDRAPALYVAYDTPDGTVVRKFVQEGENDTFTEAATSNPLAGVPAPALAVNDLADKPSADADVVVTTGQNLYVLAADDLETTAAFRDVGEGEALLNPGTTGFGRNTAALGADRIYVTRDNGNQLVLRLSDGERVCRASDVGAVPGCSQAEFSEHADNNNSTFAIGQPALSHKFSTFLSGTGTGTGPTGGVFAYKDSPIPPVPSFTMAPNPVKQGDVVTFDASASKDSDGTVVRYEWDLDGNGDFETDKGAEPKFQAAAAVPGTFNVRLRITDDEGATATLAKDLVITPPPPPPPNQPPTASFTASPSSPQTGDEVTFDARGSKDPDGSITRYEWDLDGNGSFERNTGTTATTARTYDEADVINVKLRVTDNAGATAEKVLQLTVTKPTRVKARRLTANVTPDSDSTLPYEFRTTGRLRLPEGTSRKRACRGRVTVTVKAGKETVSRRTTKLRRNCRYSKRVRFADADRLEDARRLKFKARFQGNRLVLPRQAKTQRVAIG